KADGSAPADMAVADQDWSIFRAYTAISDAESGAENTGINSDLRNFDNWTSGKDLVASDEQWNITLYADAIETDTTTFNGWTTSERNYINIYTPYLQSEVGISQRHTGVWSENAFTVTETDDAAFYLQEDHLRLSGVQIHMINATNYRNPINAE